MGLLNGLYIFPILFLFFFFVFPTIISLLIKLLLKIFKAVMIFKPVLHSVVPDGVFKDYELKEDEFDAIIVGAGPAGSSAAFYASQAGLKILLLEKNTFPFEKPCGNCINTITMKVLQDMGLFEPLKESGALYFLNSASFIAPSGMTYTGSTTQIVGEPLSATIKRSILDEALAKRAQEMGALLMEGMEVTDTNFSSETSMWSVQCNNDVSYIGRVLILCDGAESKIGIKLGNVTEPPQGLCSLSQISKNENSTNIDAFVGYPPYSLPAICSLIKQPDGSQQLSYYLVPCGDHEMERRENVIGDTVASDLLPLHNYLTYTDPYFSPLISSNAKISKTITAPLRCANQGATCYGDHLLICGAAAGFTDTLTGMGIDASLLSGREAALTMIEMYNEGDYTSMSTRRYSDRCFANFFGESELSKAAAEAIMGNPVSVDALVETFQAGGNKMFALWAKLVTNYIPKETVLNSDFGYPFAKKMVFLYLKQKVFGRFFFKYYNYKGAYDGPYIRVKPNETTSVGSS